MAKVTDKQKTLKSPTKGKKRSPQKPSKALKKSKPTPKTSKTKRKATKKKKLPPYYTFGRPTKYLPKYCKAMVKYFDVPYFIKKKINKVVGSQLVEMEIEVPNRIPLFEGFARSIGVDADTIVNWTKVHEDFFGAYKTAKGLQKEMLVFLAVNGHLQSSYAIFLTKNITDFRDRVDADITSKGKQIAGGNITNIIQGLKDKPIDELQKIA